MNSEIIIPEKITNKRDFLIFLQKERDDMTGLGFEIRKDIGEKLIMNAKQRNDFLQHINILSIGIPGAAYFTGSIVNEKYFLTSIVFLCYL